MNYVKLLKADDGLEKLLMFLDIFISRNLIIKIDNYPDYDISQYRRSEITEYYFRNKWNFKYLFDKVINCKILTSKIFHIDSLIDSSLIKGNSDDDLEQWLNEIDYHSPEFFAENGTNLNEIDDFKVYEIRLLHIDNNEKDIIYEGSFLGNNDNIDTLDYGVFSKLKVDAINNFFELFYYEVLAEAYLLFTSKNYKLAFFVCFSALESFINTELGAYEENKLEKGKQKRLNEKLKKLFKLKLTTLEKHKIYTSIINDLALYIKTRNTIAHGTKPIEVTETFTKRFLIFTCTILIIYQNQIVTFQQLFENCKIITGKKIFL
ncbi:hypothetical protein PFY10_19885 [Chryseobacterium daecheongense]|nr:hypothetical protein PFY10_19885 [Chryseobacterium daecheongense]